MSAQAVARRYANALADAVKGHGHGKALEVQSELAAWDRMVHENPQLQEVFANPTIPYEQKRRVVTTLIARAHITQTTANFLQVLLQNHRLQDLPLINQYFAQELDRRSGTVSAEITTARPLSEQAQQTLRRRLTELTRKEVRLHFSTDEELIGGVVTRIGSTVYDGSVRNQLQQMKDRMIGEV